MKNTKLSGSAFKQDISNPGSDSKGINPDFHRTGRYGNFPGKLAEILFKTTFCCPNRTYRQLIGR